MSTDNRQSMSKPLNKISRELVVRPYREGDENDIIKLFKLAFKKDMGIDFWRWQYKASPAGGSVTNLMWDHKVLVGHYSVLLHPVCLEGQELIAGLSSLTMTHPDYCGQGVFPTLAKHVYERLEKKLLLMVLGFPNTRSHRIFARDLSWMTIYEIPTFRLFAKDFQFKGVSDCLVELNAFDRRFDDLWERTKQYYAICVPRHADYLNWRYFEHPHNDYKVISFVSKNEVLGYVVWKRYGQDVEINDIWTIPEPEVALELVQKVINIARQLAADSVKIWLNVADDLHPALEKLYFQNTAPITFFGFKPLASCGASTTSLVGNFSNWYMTMGDSDIY